MTGSELGSWKSSAVVNLLTLLLLALLKNTPLKWHNRTYGCGRVSQWGDKIFYIISITLKCSLIEHSAVCLSITIFDEIVYFQFDKLRCLLPYLEFFQQSYKLTLLWLKSKSLRVVETWNIFTVFIFHFIINGVECINTWLLSWLKGTTCLQLVSWLHRNMILGRHYHNDRLSCSWKPASPVWHLHQKLMFKEKLWTRAMSSQE